MAIAVIVNSVSGKMGKETALAIQGSSDFTLVAGVSSQGPTLGANLIVPSGCIFSTMALTLASVKADVYVDFTCASRAIDSISMALDAGLHVVTGTTGIPDTLLLDLGQKAENTNRSLIFAPNFSLGAVVMAQASRLAAKYFTAAEIVEFHHEAKADAPSGTSIHTARIIAGDVNLAEKKTDQHIILSEPHRSRGQTVSGIPIHSVRLPGLVAHQEVVFGGSDELLTIRHDAFGRKCFMSGVLLAISKAVTRRGLIYGLEDLLD